ncbi:MAG: UDP-N-acetylmuramoyl-tripeptide--D-alanyl-D-alanine ligase [Pseudomonadota bacterium]
MSVLWTAADAIRATGGEGREGWAATGVSIDTRTLAKGDLFVALEDQRDGHDFVAAALENGACAALVSRVPEAVRSDAPLLVVPHVLDALEALARAARARTRAHVIAVTGSAGKTSTKDMLRAVLGAQGRTHVAEASYNNHWGVPLTLARMPAETEFAVIEIGMNRPGEIAPLAHLARPHVAIVTTVAAAHLEAFDDIEGIAREKGAIFEGLEPEGVAILNGDIPTAPVLRRAAAGARQRIEFGVGREAAYRLDDAALVSDATVVQATRNMSPILFKIGVPGRHFAMNALAVLAAVDAVGADAVLAACDLGQWGPPQGRGTRETLVLDLVEDSLTIDLIDDAFNANPASVAAAFDVLEAAAPSGTPGLASGGRRVAVLGDMLELGGEAADLHADLARHPSMASVDIVHCAGPLMGALWSALPAAQQGERAASAEELAAIADQLVRAGDVVLVKGSKGSRVSLVAEAIRGLAEPSPAMV